MINVLSGFMLVTTTLRVKVAIEMGLGLENSTCPLEPANGCSEYVLPGIHIKRVDSNQIVI